MTDQSPGLLQRVDSLERTVADLQANLGAIQHTLHQNNLRVFYPLPTPATQPPPVPPRPPEPLDQRAPRMIPAQSRPGYMAPVNESMAITPAPPLSPAPPAPLSAQATAESRSPAIAPRPATPARQAYTAAGPSTPPAQIAPSAPLHPPRPPRDLVRSTEYWLNKVGIGLFLLGIMFFFKYSIDKGWITPALRVGMGLLTGFGLLGIGLRLPRERRAFAQVILGGSIATLYISIFAAFQFYTLIPFPLAFGSMVGITLLGLVLGVRQDEVVLALIAALGGLGTPFLLYTGSSNLPGLIGYTCLLLAGTTAIYYFKGWRSLLGATLAGGALILLLAYNTLPFNPQMGASDRWAVQFGTISVWLLFWLVPIARALGQAPASAAPTQRTNRLEIVIERLVSGISQPTHQLSITLGLLALRFSGSIWQLDPTALGWLAMAAAGIYAVVGLALHQHSNGRQLAYTQGLVASVMFTIGLALLLHGDVLFWALAAEAIVLHGLARRLDDPLFTFSGHGLATILACWFILRLEPTLTQTAFLNPRALTELAVLASLYAVATIFTVAIDRRIYQLVIHAAMLALVWRELAADPTYMTMLAWAGYAALLHVLAVRFKREEWTILAHAACVGVATFFIVSLTGLPSRHSTLGNWRPLSDLVIMALLYALPVLVGRLAGPFRHTLVYRLAIHAALLAWFGRELVHYPTGWLLVAWAANVLLLFFVAKREQAEEYTWLANIAAIGIAALFMLSFINLPAQRVPILNTMALLQLGAMGILGAATLLMSRQSPRLMYRLLLHVALLAWLGRELAHYPTGWLLVVWASHALVLFSLAKREQAEEYALLAHAVAIGVVGLFLISLGNVPYQQLPMLNPVALLQLGAMCFLGAAALLMAEHRMRLIYGVAIYVALLAWFWREWSSIASGNAYITMSWG
ncbi:MAG: DUF2339 domain-containing protein, partial [Herpetosiphonaceae bacterium]|nr:DUF2339 domain-containing protein [Herpetosiphonaceae bacterium]